MIVAVYLPLILPALVVPLVRLVCWRLPPALASWLVALTSLVLAGCASAALALLMFAALTGVGIFAHLGHWSPAVFRQLDAVHLPIDIAAGLALVVLLVNMARLAIGRVRALRTTHRMARSGDSELMVVEDDHPLAHALPGRPGRIVVSTSMLAVLGPAERRALLAHERAHLANAHHLFVGAVDVLAGLNPLLRPLTRAIRYTTERWADEVAAGEVGDRSVVAQAVAKAALASKANPIDNGVALAATTGPVPRRVAALLTAPPVRRLWSIVTSPTGLVAAVACGLLLGSVLASLDAVTDLHRVVELAQYARHATMKWP
ncbi:MAG TPA: M56 family metallopeptidase [Pseudonocardiaceae bacterium]|nr:M56 family metallopeptidase [Pseudonocardiaceae bacterium]